MSTNRIDLKFADLKKASRKALIAYIVAGDPDLKTTRDLVLAMEEAGVDILELGVPFSDPIADGVINQRAAQRALEQKTSLTKILDFMSQLRRESQLPILLFSYFNPVFKYGLERFAIDSKDAQVDGSLIVDLPPEEAREYKEAMAPRGLKTVFLAAPTSTEKRIQLISQFSTGFIYYVSREGVTGVREQMLESVRPMVERIRHFSPLPIAVGFGVSTPQMVEEVAQFSDGVVVGSALVKTIEENLGNKELVKRVSQKVRELAQGVIQKS